MPESSAIERLKDDSIKEVILTNTINISDEMKIDKMKIISLAEIIAESINRVYKGEPMGVLFEGLYEKLAKKIVSK